MTPSTSTPRRSSITADHRHFRRSPGPYAKASAAGPPPYPPSPLPFPPARVARVHQLPGAALHSPNCPFMHVRCMLRVQSLHYASTTVVHTATRCRYLDCQVAVDNFCCRRRCRRPCCPARRRQRTQACKATKDHELDTAVGREGHSAVGRHNTPERGCRQTACPGRGIPLTRSHSGTCSPSSNAGVCSRPAHHRNRSSWFPRQDALKIARHCKRTQLTTQDINNALRLRNMEVSMPAGCRAACGTGVCHQLRSTPGPFPERLCACCNQPYVSSS